MFTFTHDQLEMLLLEAIDRARGYEANGSNQETAGVQAAIETIDSLDTDKEKTRAAKQDRGPQWPQGEG